MDQSGPGWIPIASNKLSRLIYERYASMLSSPKPRLPEEEIVRRASLASAIAALGDFPNTKRYRRVKGVSPTGFERRFLRLYGSQDTEQMLESLERILLPRPSELEPGRHVELVRGLITELRQITIQGVNGYRKNLDLPQVQWNPDPKRIALGLTLRDHLREGTVLRSTYREVLRGFGNFG